LATFIPTRLNNNSMLKPEGLRARFYRGVTNAEEVLQKSGPNVVVVDLCNVVSEFHVLNATMKALLAWTGESGFRARTPSFRAEVLYNLSATGKITETSAQFGATGSSTSIALVGIVTDDPKITIEGCREAAQYETLVAAVQGTEFDPALLLSDQEFTTKEKRLTLIKLFKITQQELDISSLEDCVITRLAVKEIC